MSTGTIAPARVIARPSRLDPQPKRAEIPTIQQIWHQLARGLFVIAVLSMLLILGLMSRPVALTNPLQAPIEWVSGLNSVPQDNCLWRTHSSSNDWYACEVTWEGWKVMLYGEGNTITHAYLRPPTSIPLGDLVQWYGRWNKAIHYPHLHHLMWDQVEVYLYTSKDETVSVMSSQVKQIQIKL